MGEELDVLEQIGHERRILKKNANFLGFNVLMLLTSNPSLSILCLLVLLCCFAILLSSFLVHCFDFNTPENAAFNR